MLKRIVIFLLLNLICLGMVHAQRITQFAVVDLPRVYTAFFRESRAVREYEERSARVQADIDRYTREITQLRSRHAEAVLQGNETEALRLENLINRRSEFLREFYQTRMAELEEQRNRLIQSSAFVDQIHNEIRFIAESEGFSLVLNLKDVQGLLWYSPSVDITDKLIQSLRTRSRN